MRESGKEIAIAVLACVAAMLCFSVVPVFLRQLTKHLDSWTVNAVRYSTAALFWLPFVLRLQRAKPPARPVGDLLVLGRRAEARVGSPAQRSVWRAALIPAAVNLVGQVGWAICPYHADAPTIGFVIRTSFLFTVVFGFLFIPAERLLGRRPMFLLGASVCLAGVVIICVGAAPQDHEQAKTSPFGVPIILATAVCWGAYAVSVRRFLSGYPLRLAFGVISLYTAAGLVLLMFGCGRFQELVRIPLRAWALLVVSGMLGIAFGHVLYYRGIHGIGPVVASGTMLAGPFVTYLTAAIFLPEDKLTLIQLLGGAVVVAGGLALVKAKAQIEAAAGAEQVQPEQP